MVIPCVCEVEGVLTRAQVSCVLRVLGWVCLHRARGHELAGPLLFATQFCTCVTMINSFPFCTVSVFVGSCCGLGRGLGAEQRAKQGRGRGSTGPLVGPLWCGEATAPPSNQANLGGPRNTHV